MPVSRDPQPGSPRGVSLATSLGRAAQSFLPSRNRFRRHDLNSPRASKSSSAQPTTKKAPPPRLGRLVTNVIDVCPQLDPDGLAIRRASSAIHPSAFSPFLLLDHCGPHPVAPDAVVSGEAPRCGQQALTYVVRGNMHLHDSCGNHAVLRPGAVSLLTAGSGVVASHSLHGPTIEYFSIWIHIPSEMRSAPPHQHTTQTPPSVVVGHGDAAARIRVLAGPRPAQSISTIRNNFDKPTAVELQTVAGSAAVYDIHMQPKSQLVLNPEAQRVFVYVYRGAALIAKKTKVEEGGFAVLEPNRDLPVVIDSYAPYSDTQSKPAHDWDDFDTFENNSCWFLMLTGDPVMEPVSMLSSGIVAGTPQEIRKAFQEYTCGSMGANSPPTHGSIAAKITADNSEDESLDTAHASSEDKGGDGGFGAFGFGELED